MGRYLFAIIATGMFALFCGCGNGGGKVTSGAAFTGIISVPPPATGDFATDASGEQSAPAKIALPDAVESIRAYEAPPDVDADVFAMLKHKLIEELERSGQEKIASRSPDNPFCRVNDISTEYSQYYSTSSLRWTYSNVGDYDLNQEVGVSDLVEIARYFGEPGWKEGCERTIESWVDGDKSGQVDIGDLTPLARNFLSRISDYQVLWAESPEGPFEEFDRVSVGMFFASSYYFEFKTSFSFAPDEYDGKHFFFAVAPFDELGQVGPISDMTPTLAMPRFSLEGVNGITDESITIDIALQGPGPFTYEWNFGGAAAPNVSAEELPEIVLGESGAYTEANLTVGNEYFTTFKSFAITVHNPASPPPNSIYVETLDQKPEGGVYFLFYACQIQVSEPVYDIEVKVVFDGAITGKDGKLESADIAGNPELDKYVRWDGLNSVLSSKTWNQMLTVQTSDYSIYGHNGLATSSAYLGCTLLSDVNSPATSPVEMRAFIYNGDLPNPDRIPFDNCTGDFSWTNVSESAEKWQGFGRAPSYPGVRDVDAYIVPESVELEWTGVLGGDYNGDYVVDLFDIRPIAYRWLARTGDGQYDDLDEQLDGDNNGEVGISDIIPVALNYGFRITSYLIYRDGAKVGEVQVWPYNDLMHLIELHHRFVFTDENASPGLHSYTIVSHDAESGTFGGTSSPKEIMVE